MHLVLYRLLYIAKFPEGHEFVKFHIVANEWILSLTKFALEINCLKIFINETDKTKMCNLRIKLSKWWKIKKQKSTTVKQINQWHEFLFFIGKLMYYDTLCGPGRNVNCLKCITLLLYIWLIVEVIKLET